jgi:hypothetical protein
MSDERVDYPQPTNEQLADFHNNLDKRMAQLEDHYAELPNSWSRDFAADLLQYYNKSERLSIKQTVWATKFWTWLAENAFNSLIAVNSKGTPVKKQPETVATTVVDGKAVIAHFDKAAEEKKYPSIKWHAQSPLLTVQEKSTVEAEAAKYKIKYIKFHRTTERNKLGAGCVQAIATMEVADYAPPAEEWICAVRRDGKVQWYPFASTKLDLQQLMRKLIEDFVPQMQANGKKYSHCCFCGLELTDAPSLAAGYGPICADKWGLPWGDAPEEEIVLGVI